MVANSHRTTDSRRPRKPGEAENGQTAQGGRRHEESSCASLIDANHSSPQIMQTLVTAGWLVRRVAVATWCFGFTGGVKGVPRTEMMGKANPNPNPVGLAMGPELPRLACSVVTLRR